MFYILESGMLQYYHSR